MNPGFYAADEGPAIVYRYPNGNFETVQERVGLVIESHLIDLIPRMTSNMNIELTNRPRGWVRKLARRFR